MKKFRRIISGFLAAALVFTQSVTTAYSDDQPDTAVTTVAETIAENAASDEKPDADDPDNENDETAEDEQVKDDEYYDALRQSIEEKRAGCYCLRYIRYGLCGPAHGRRMGISAEPNSGRLREIGFKYRCCGVQI